MAEQFKLDLPEPVKRTKEEEAEERQTLEEEYRNVVGVNPLARAFSLEALRAGIAAGREAERLRLGEIDKESDREEREKTYRR